MKFTTASLIALNAIAVGAFAPSNPAAPIAGARVGPTTPLVGPLNLLIDKGEEEECCCMIVENKRRKWLNFIDTGSFVFEFDGCMLFIFPRHQQLANSYLCLFSAPTLLYYRHRSSH